ncbi:MAG: alanine racemase [Nitrospirota bacterium]|nr:alanine racemase [Nitrospirota bacterium]MDH5767641.1 alanine racemase [Nitrospirota bacterium]
MNRGAIAEVNLSAIAHNFRAVRKIVKNRQIIAVVKADAYGHGAVKVSKKFIKEGASCLAVAFIDEAVKLRDAGITAPIIVLFDRKEVREFFDFKLIPVIYTIDGALSLSTEAKKRNTVLQIHVKVDTGMGRIGLSSNSLIDDLEKIAKMDGVEITGLLSHFSDADLTDKSFAALQLERFNKIREAVSKNLNRKIFSHIANSAAVLTFKEAYLDAVRPGIMLYGYSPLCENSNPSQSPRILPVTLMPAMKIKTKLLCIRNVSSGSPVSYGRSFITRRQSRIGVIPVGYADGYNRLFSNNAEVLIRGRRVPVVGRVCMDLTMIDVTDIRNVREDDEVIMLGQQGKESITACELAYRSHTIPYEILTSLGSRSRKIYRY